MNYLSPVQPSTGGDLDLTACDREPIHLSGAIQPHGLLLVASVEDDLRVVGGAGDIEGRLAAEWMGRPLNGLIGAWVTDGLVPGVGEAAAVVGSAEGLHERFDVSIRRQGEFWTVQLEPVASQAWTGVDALAWLDAAGGVFERASDLQALCERAVEVFRELIGFDRVMIYRFLDDGAGLVIAEAREPGFDAFLNHHFPATDIPKQARALYVRNRVRVIPDVDYAPAPLRPAAELAGLDLSDVDLRSVSPIHLQYLRNMGVRASASVSIVKDGLLWGLVACHASTPRDLPLTHRMLAQTLAGALARQVRAKEEAEDYRERIRLRAAEDAVAGRLASEATSDNFYTDAVEELRRMLAADGFAVLQGKAIHCNGHCPDTADVREVARWLLANGSAQPFQTHALPELFPSAGAYRELASGLLAVVLSVEEPVVLMWFRAEQVQVVDWAGNPHKAQSPDPNVQLSPRASFALWREEVCGRARPWSLGEIEAAHRLTRSLYDARQTRRIRELNRDLTATVADKEALLTQKDYLLKEVNHRIQNSLQLVSAFLGLQARSASDDVLTGHLAEAQRRLSAVALVHRRLYSDDNVEMVDLGRYLEDLCKEMKVSMGEGWAEKLKLDLAPTLISADRAVNVGLILTELVINANKYAYGGAPGPLAISLEQHRNRFRLIVADDGPGKSGAREGFGTRMLNAMVDRLKGSLEEMPNRPGLRVIVTAPLTDA